MTLQQVAQHAGVSASTVSRVINDMPGITVETADAVRRSMTALAYTPNGRRKARGRAATADVAGAKVAFVVLNLTGDSSVPAYQYLLRGVSTAANQLRLDLQVSFVSDAESAIGRLSGSSVDGLVLHGTFDSAEQSRPLHRVPTVWLMGNRRRPVWGDQVMPDNALIGQIAANYLLNRGRRRVVYFGMRSGWSLDIRMLAFQQSIEDAGATVHAVAHRPAASDRVTDADRDAALESLVAALRSSGPKPDGLFLAEDWLVRPTFNALRAAGIAPGEDIDIVSCNNDRAHLIGVSPMPATIDIRYESIGYRAVEQLADRLAGNRPTDRVRLMLEPTLVLPDGVPA